MSHENHCGGDALAPPIRPFVAGGFRDALVRVRIVRSIAVAVVLIAMWTTESGAVDSTSASFTLRGLHPASIGPVRMAPAMPSGQISASGASLGQGEAVGASGALGGSLRTNLPGFWGRVSGAVPSLDADGDGLARFLDPDDDEDGLLDTEEYSIGTNSLLADTDGDGVIDAVEVALGTNPLDPLDPAPALVPSLSGLVLVVVSVLMIATALRSLRMRAKPS